ncbi:hypothetical protein [Halorussus lipolyticus]|uniref:hypothetical protein n=1 Tax=Halorussus lipolyticus TaxID=3034024 RepID=UPI0023E78C66|nr:hypothetical protein [Halorussus sp. DT80]
MAETAYLTSALVTGALLLAVWTLVLRMENWRRYELAGGGAGGADGRAGTDGGGRTRRAGANADDSVGAWVAGFVLLAALAGGGAVLLVSDPALAAAVGNWVALALVFGVLLGGFLLWGTYSSARFRGLPSAHAALVSAWLFGALFVAGIAAKLVLAG